MRWLKFTAAGNTASTPSWGLVEGDTVTTVDGTVVIDEPARFIQGSLLVLGLLRCLSAVIGNGGQDAIAQVGAKLEVIEFSSNVRNLRLLESQIVRAYL